MGKNPNIITVRSFDPGKHLDTFAMIETKIDIKAQKVLITGAFGWKHDDYTKIEKDINTIHLADPADFYVCEKNNTGTHVIDSLRSIYNIPVHAVTTALGIKSEKVISKGETMDKMDIVKSVKQLKKAKRLGIVKDKTPGLKLFVSQLNSFVKKMTKAGRVTYAADGTGHDDYIMAFLINMHFVLVKFLKRAVTRTVLTKKFKKEMYDDHINEIDGSGIPPGARLTGRKISMPGSNW